MKQNESFPNGLPYHLWYDEIFYPNWNKHAVEPSKEVLQFRYNEYLQRIERNNYQRLLDSNKELLESILFNNKLYKMRFLLREITFSDNSKGRYMVVNHPAGSIGKVKITLKQWKEFKTLGVSVDEMKASITQQQLNAVL
jgi:hypothetical protein